MSPEAATSRYRTLPRTTYDLVTLGGGSAGLTAARLARALHASVALIDREKLGGECLYTGCVPSKALLHVARVAAAIRQSGALGLRATVESTDLSAVMDYAERAIDAVYEESDAPEHLVALGVDIAFGEARFISPRALIVNGQIVTARRILIATGSHPAIPDIPGLHETGFVTNETVFAMRSLPARLAVIGGGPVGCELGQAFARIGSQVTLLQRSARLLPKDEPEASAILHNRLASEGVTIALRAEVLQVTRSAGGIVLSVREGDGARDVIVDAILVATGRAPNVADLGLKAGGIQYDARRGVDVDAFLRTTNPRVYAAGDVTGGYHFTHAAALDARVAVRNALFPGKTRLDTRAMPWATFTEPEIAHVGLTEEQARRLYGAGVQSAVQPYSGVDRAITDGATPGFVKLVHSASGNLLGAQIVGPRAGDNINELALAIAHRFTIAQIAAATHVYPTFALAIQQAAGNFTMRHTARSATIGLLLRIGRWARP